MEMDRCTVERSDVPSRPSWEQNPGLEEHRYPLIGLDRQLSSVPYTLGPRTRMRRTVPRKIGCHARSSARRRRLCGAGAPAVNVQSRVVPRGGAQRPD